MVGFQEQVHASGHTQSSVHSTEHTSLIRNSRRLYGSHHPVSTVTLRCQLFAGGISLPRGPGRGPGIVILFLFTATTFLQWVLLLSLEPTNPASRGLGSREAPLPEPNTLASPIPANTSEEAVMNTTSCLQSAVASRSSLYGKTCRGMYPPPPPFSGKKGIGMTLREETAPTNSSTSTRSGTWRQNLPRIIALNPYWNYSWNLKRIAAQPDHIEFVPMVYGPTSSARKLKRKLERLVGPLLGRGLVHRIFGFNEPDNEQQSNTDVATALSRWPILEALDLPVVGPSCHRSHGAWSKHFMATAFASCHRVDWIGVHWYGGANFTSFARRLRKVYKLHGKRRRLVITEFAPADWEAVTPEQNRFQQLDVLEFMKRALPWLESRHWIAGYSWFSFPIDSAVGTSSALFDEAGNLTACGRYYASVRTDTPMGDQSIQVQ